MEPRTIGRMVVLEAVVVGVLGSAVGAVLAVGMQLAFHALTPLLIGWENPMRLRVCGRCPSTARSQSSWSPLLQRCQLGEPRVNVVEALAYE